MNHDECFMQRAIELSKLAVTHGNEPFGAVLVKDGKIVFENENQIYTQNDPTFHAEMGLVRLFQEATHISDLSDYTLYSSCEPCFMCSGALFWLNLGRLVYGASDQELCELLGVKGDEPATMVLGSRCKITSGVLREESLAVLRDYFKNHKKG